MVHTAVGVEAEETLAVTRCQEHREIGREQHQAQTIGVKLYHHR